MGVYACMRMTCCGCCCWRRGCVVHLNQAVLKAWEGEMRKGAALRGHVKGAVNVMEGAINHRWLRQVLRSWRGVGDGPSSKKACQQRYAARRDAARAALQVKVASEKLHAPTKSAKR